MTVRPGARPPAVLTWLTVLAALTALTGCAIPEGAGADPEVSAFYDCGAATGRAEPNPKLGARQTSYTVIGRFPDAATAAQAAQDLHGIVASLLELLERGEPLNLPGQDLPGQDLPDPGDLGVPPQLLEGLTDLENSVTRLGQTVFLRAEGKRPLDPGPLASWMDRLGAETLVEVPGDQRVMHVDLIWDTEDSGLDRALTEQIGDYLAMPFELMTVAPWAPGGVTPEQAAVRRDFRAIRSFAYDIPPKQRIADAEEIIAAAERGGEKLRRAFAEQEKRSLERLTRRTREFLEAHPEIDPELVAGFLRWSTTFDLPVRYQLAADLGKPMGQLRYGPKADGACCLVQDPLEAYKGLGSVDRISWPGLGQRLTASFIAKDIAVGLPALADYLCQRGVDGMSYRITDYSAYM